MANVDESAVRAALNTVMDPERGKDILSLGLVSGVAIQGNTVVVTLEADPDSAPRLEALRQSAEAAVRAVPGVGSASVVLTGERAAPPPPTLGKPRAPGRDDSLLPGVRTIVAVASGKGGVGKSTTAVNLALALKDLGLAVGLFDADVYGPSQPRLLGVADAKPQSADGKQIDPIIAYGLEVMSIGFLVPEDSPVVWRGPMVAGAVEQLLRDVRWGALDVMVIDMPPGTGDTQLTITQKLPLSGAVIVSTPQDIALIDARKGLKMFEKVDVPTIGIIENMSTFVCPNCGHEEHIFGHGGARTEAEQLGTPFLGELPLDISIRATSDAGTPVVVSDPQGPAALAFRQIAIKVWAALEQEGGRWPSTPQA